MMIVSNLPKNRSLPISFARSNTINKHFHCVRAGCGYSFTRYTQMGQHLLQHQAAAVGGLQHVSDKPGKYGERIVGTFLPIFLSRRLYEKYIFQTLIISRKRSRRKCCLRPDPKPPRRRPIRLPANGRQRVSVTDISISIALYSTLAFC